MKRYKFRLESVLRVRRIQEDLARAEVLAANARTAEAEAAVQRRMLHYRDTATPPPGAYTTEAFLAGRSGQDLAARSLVAAGTARQEARALAAERVTAYTAAAARVQALERLDAKRREEHALETLKDEDLQVDDLVNSRWMEKHAS